MHCSCKQLIPWSWHLVWQEVTGNLNPVSFPFCIKLSVEMWPSWMQSIRNSLWIFRPCVCDGEFEVLGSSPIPGMLINITAQVKWVFTFSQFTNLFVRHVENDKQMHLTCNDIKKADSFGMSKLRKTFRFNNLCRFF